MSRWLLMAKFTQGHSLAIMTSNDTLGSIEQALADAGAATVLSKKQMEENARLAGISGTDPACQILALFGNWNKQSANNISISVTDIGDLVCPAPIAIAGKQSSKELLELLNRVKSDLRE